MPILEQTYSFGQYGRLSYIAKGLGVKHSDLRTIFSWQKGSGPLCSAQRSERRQDAPTRVQTRHGTARGIGEKAKRAVIPRLRSEPFPPREGGGKGLGAQRRKKEESTRPT